MFRRIVLAFTFVAALSAAGVGVVSKAQAHGGGCGYGGYGGYGGYSANYGYPSYGGGFYGGYPTVYRSYYAPAYPGGFGAGYYGGGGHRHRHHRDHGGVSFSIGF